MLVFRIFDDKIEFYNPGRLPDNITIEDLLANTYRSTPRNKLIADFFKDLGLIEKYGSGIARIINCFKAENLHFPKFQNISDGFMVTVFSDKVSDNIATVVDVTKDVIKDVTKEKRGNLIIELIHENREITILEMANRLKTTSRTIIREIKNLKSQHRISRKGGRKNGHWELTNQ